MIFAVVCLVLSAAPAAVGTYAVLAASPRPARARHAARRNPYAAPTGDVL